jgi:hypothetical protein
MLQRLYRMPIAGEASDTSDAMPVSRDLRDRFERIKLPGDHSRFRSISWPLTGVLVLVASWTVAISYYFHHRSSR